jgi:PAS domain S-box-containing protein
VGVCLDITDRKRAEEALRVSENLYRTLSEAVPDFVWSCDDRGQLDFVNSRWLEYAGMTVEELNAGGVEQIYYPEDFSWVMQQWNLAIQKQEPFETECRYRRKDGVYRWFMVRAVPLQDAQGNIIKWIGTTTDIHERKQAEQALREQEERLSTALWASATGTYRWDIHTNAVDWDENLNRLFGLPEGATVRQLEEFVAFIHPDDRESVVAQMERCIQSGVDFDMEFRIIWPDGSLHWILDKGKTVFDEQGNPLYMTGACLDVTERKQTTEALSQSEERLRVALKNSPVSVFNHDRELRYIWKYNPMFDHDVKAVIGKRDIDLLPQDDAEVLTRIKRQVLETGVGAREEIKITLQGKDWYYDLTVEPLRDAKNEVIGVTCAAVNITEYKQTEIALRKSETVLNALLASSPIAIAFLDRDLRYIHANEALAAMNGLPLSEHMGRTLGEVLPDWAPHLAPILQQVMETQQPLLNQELSGETNPPGIHRHCLVNYYPVCLADGQILGVGISSMDVTELKQVEHALRESESRFRWMADGAPMFIWMSGTDGHCTYFNQLWLEFVGQTLDEALTTGWPEGIHPDDKDYCLQTYLSAFNARQRFQVEYRHRRHDGEYRWLLDEGVPLFNGDGTFLGYIGSGIDISDRKRTEQAQQYLIEASRILSSSLDYQTILTNLAHLAVPQLADWSTVHLIEDNGSVQPLATAHVNPDKIVWAKQINEKYPFDPNAASGVANVLRTGQSEFYPDIPDHLLVKTARDAEHLRILREVGFSSAIIVPMLVRGRTLGAISFIAAESGRRYDLADLALAEELAHRAALAVENARLYQQAQQARQKAEQAAERTARLQAVTAAFSEALTPNQVAEVVVNQGIAALGITTGFVALLTDNDTSLEIVQSVGLPQELIESWRRFPITAPVPLAELVRTRQPIFLESVEAFTTQYPILAHAPMSTGNNAFACIPVMVEGQILGGISFSFAEARAFNADDRAFMLTLGYLCGQAIVRARLYEAEQGARRDAEAANRIKDEFLAVLSHELRSPLNPILGWTKLLRSRKFDEKATDRALETIERNAKLQTQLIEDLLDVSRILRGKLVLNVAPVNLVTTIEAAMETVRLAAQAKDIQIETTIEPNVGQVSGDANRLQQVIWNLLSNAIKFTPQGGRVEVRLSTDCDGKDCNLNSKFQYAQIQVKDTGKGISPKFLPYVFEYFRQENSSTTRQFGGLGLGLAIVRYLTELHGGSVQADSPGEGLGATFTVRLPLMVAQEEAPQEPMRSISSVNLNGLHILIVDDEADIRELVAFILEQSGAIISVATSAEEALLALEKSVPDILLSDIGMPNVDGYTLMRQIRELFAQQEGQVPGFSAAMPKAIALTAYAGEYNQQQALQAGFQLHISKPVEPEELVNAIARLAEFEFTDC